MAINEHSQRTIELSRMSSAGVLLDTVMEELNRKLVTGAYNTAPIDSLTPTWQARSRLKYPWIKRKGEKGREGRGEHSDQNVQWFNYYMHDGFLSP